MGFDNAYEAITEGSGEDTRWAFGTGFADPLAGVDASLPAGVDGADLAAYCLMLGDDALIMSHRLQQWCTNAPELEDEVALANIALDLLGQSRLLLTRAGTANNSGAEASGGAQASGGADSVRRDGRPYEDYYAYFRDEHEFRNARLVELDNGDFACTVARLLVFSTWRLALLNGLTSSADPVLAAVADKGVKEVTYHRDYAAQWTVRLGDGTSYSHERMQAGLDVVWPYVDELFVPHDVERRLSVAAGDSSVVQGQPMVAVDPSTVRDEFDDVLAQVLNAATLQRPDVAPRPGVAGRYGRHGVHTETMGYILAEMQSLARAHPDATW